MGLTELSLVGNILTAIFAVFSWCQWRFARGQLQLQLISEFHDKLIQFHEDLEDIFYFDSYSELRADHRKIVGSYIKTCSDQYFRWKAGMIPKQLWLDWENKIRDRFQHPVIRSAWHDGRHRTNYPGDFAAHIDSLIINDNNNNID